MLFYRWDNGILKSFALDLVYNIIQIHFKERWKVLSAKEPRKLRSVMRRSPTYQQNQIFQSRMSTDSQRRWFLNPNQWRERLKISLITYLKQKDNLHIAVKVLIKETRLLRITLQHFNIRTNRANFNNKPNNLQASLSLHRGRLTNWRPLVKIGRTILRNKKRKGKDIISLSIPTINPCYLRKRNIRASFEEISWYSLRRGENSQRDLEKSISFPMRSSLRIWKERALKLRRFRNIQVRKAQKRKINLASLCLKWW